MKKLFGTLLLALLLLCGTASAQIPWVYPLYPFMDTVVFDEDLQIRELSSAPSTVSGYGLVYALSADNKLYYKDSSGNTFDLSSPPGGAAGNVDTSGTPVDNDFAKFTDADTIEGRSYSETAGDLEAEIEAAIDTLDNLASIRDSAAGGVALFGSAGSGETQAFTVSGYKAGDAKRTFSLAIGSVSNDTATITGCSYYTFTGQLSATTYASDGSVTDAELKYINTLGSNAQSQIDGKQASDAALTDISGLTYASASFIKFVANDDYSVRTLAETAGDLEAEIEADIDTLANLTSIQGQTFTLGGALVTQNNNVTINAVDAARTITLTESLTIVGGQDVDLHASGGEKAQLAIDTQNAERTLDMSANLTVEATSTINSDLSNDANWSTSGSITGTKGYVHGAETTATPSGAFTVDWSAKQVQRVTITGVALDITFTNPSGPVKGLILVIVQGDGDDTIDWTNEADILFPGGVDPTLSIGAGDIDVVAFYFDGTNYLGLFNGNFD